MTILLTAAKELERMAISLHGDVVAGRPQWTDFLAAIAHAPESPFRIACIEFRDAIQRGGVIKLQYLGNGKTWTDPRWTTFVKAIADEEIRMKERMK